MSCLDVAFAPVRCGVFVTFCAIDARLAAIACWWGRRTRESTRIESRASRNGVEGPARHARRPERIHTCPPQRRATN